jgi:hypothetical protein
MPRAILGTRATRSYPWTRCSSSRRSRAWPCVTHSGRRPSADMGTEHKQIHDIFHRISIGIPSPQQPTYSPPTSINTIFISKLEKCGLQKQISHVIPASSRDINLAVGRPQYSHLTVFTYLALYADQLPTGIAQRV